MRLAGVQQEKAKRLKGISPGAGRPGCDVHPATDWLCGRSKADPTVCLSFLPYRVRDQTGLMSEQVSGEVLQMFSLTQTRIPRGARQGPLLHSLEAASSQVKQDWLMT